MGLTRYLFQWIIDFGATPDAGGAALLAASAVGAAMLGFRIFDGVTDPIAGAVADAWVRRGRGRRGLLLWTFWAPSLGLALCFLPTHAMPPSARWAIVFAGLFVFFVGYTFYAIPYWSLIEDYSENDDGVRRSLSNLLGVGLIVATGVGFVGSPALVERFGHRVGALVFALPALALMVLPFFAAPSEGRAISVPAPARRASTWTPVIEALKDRRFVSVIVLFAGSQMSFTLMTAAAPFIAVDLLGGSTGDVAMILGPLLVAALPAFAWTPRLSAKWGWERVVLVASLALAVVYAASALLGASLVGSPLVTASLLFALGGPSVAALLGLEGEAVTACARAAHGGVSSYFGVYNMLVKSANGAAMLLAGLIAQSVRSGGGKSVARWFGPAAGLCLAAGVIAHRALRPRELPIAARTAREQCHK